MEHRDLDDVLRASCIIWLTVFYQLGSPSCTLLCSSLQKESMASFLGTCDLCPPCNSSLLRNPVPFLPRTIRTCLGLPRCLSQSGTLCLLPLSAPKLKTHLYWETMLLPEEGIGALGCRDEGKLQGDGMVDKDSRVFVEGLGLVANERGRQRVEGKEGDGFGELLELCRLLLKTRWSGGARLT